MIDISVIMAVYNTGESGVLAKAIESILFQTFTEFEFIICDDCSTDNTYEILKEYAESDRRIKLLRNERNLKSGAARNRCLQIAQGKYIAIMDADDFSDQNRLDTQIAFLEKNREFSFVGCRGQYFYMNPGDCTQQYWYLARPQSGDFLVTLPFVHASIMFRKDAIMSVHGYMESRRVTRSEDYDLLMRIYSTGLTGANLGDKLYYIRLDNQTLRRRKYRYRFCEFVVKWTGFIKLGLMPKGIIYAMKPLLIGLIPAKYLEKAKQIYYRKRNKL